MVTISLPVVARTTTVMDNDNAYALTKTFWTQKSDLGKAAAWCNGVAGAMLANVYGKLHPGAVKFHDEAGTMFPDALR